MHQIEERFDITGINYYTELCLFWEGKNDKDDREGMLKNGSLAYN